MSRALTEDLELDFEYSFTPSELERAWDPDPDLDAPIELSSTPSAPATAEPPAAVPAAATPAAPIPVAATSTASKKSRSRSRAQRRAAQEKEVTPAVQKVSTKRGGRRRQPRNFYTGPPLDPRIERLRPLHPEALLHHVDILQRQCDAEKEANRQTQYHNQRLHCHLQAAVAERDAALRQLESVGRLHHKSTERYFALQEKATEGTRFVIELTQTETERLKRYEGAQERIAELEDQLARACARTARAEKFIHSCALPHIRCLLSQLEACGQEDIFDPSQADQWKVPAAPDGDREDDFLEGPNSST